MRGTVLRVQMLQSSTKRAFNGVRVFSATMFADRAALGEKVTGWIANNSHLEVTDYVVTQSSDAAFHCVAITVFYWQDPKH